jgi:phosphonate transport system permease protein
LEPRRTHAAGHDEVAGHEPGQRATYAAYRLHNRHLLGRRLVTWSVVIGGLSWAIAGTGFGIVTLGQGIYRSAEFVIQDMLPPRLETIPRFIDPALETLYMSYVGMVISIVLSLPLAVLAARNTTVHRAVGYLSKGAIGFVRAMPEIVFAIFVVAVVGIGPLAGTIAIGIGGIGILGKGFADAIETADMRQAEGIRSAGGGWLHVLGQGVWPQFKPAFITWSLYRLELNIRNATILGFVGAGGLGYSLTREERLFQYRNVTTIILMIFVMIIAVEMTTRALRRRSL